MANRFEKAREYTRKYKDVLLPCKECGSHDIQIVSDRTIFDPHNVWSVDCVCGNCVYGRKRVKDAIEKWNEMNKKEIVS